MAKYCSNCGRELDDNIRFCSSCGFDIMSGRDQNSRQQSGYASGYRSGDYVGPHKMKSEGVAIILSFLIPGLGHIYVGKIGIGLLMILLALLFAVIGALFLIPLVLYLAIWIYAMYSSYKDANEYNDTLMRTGQPPW